MSQNVSLSLALHISVSLGGYAWSHVKARGSTTHTHLQDQSCTSCTGALMSVAQSVSVAQHDICHLWGSTLY